MEKFSTNYPKGRAVQYCGAYIIVHLKSGKMYVGSTSDLARRKSAHESELRFNRHHNAELQALYNEDSSIEFHSYITNDREEAFAAEQDAIDHYGESGLLINIARDVKASGKGLKRSEETKERVRTARAKQVLTQGQIDGLKWGAQQSNERRSFPVCINGVHYPSVSDAARQLGLQFTKVLYRVKSDSKKFENWKIATSNEK